MKAMKSRRMLGLALGLVTLASGLLVACGGADTVTIDPEVKVFERTTAPDKLSSWALVISDGATMRLNNHTVAYDLNSPLFSDYSSKQRALFVPAGKKITYNQSDSDPLDLPVGSVIVKTFYYPKGATTTAGYTGVLAVSHQTEQGETLDLSKVQLVETRLLVRQADGQWLGLPYVWDADQKDASLRIGGATAKLDITKPDGAHVPTLYKVPSAQQCQQCHATTSAGGGAILPIGPKARNLNKTYAYADGAKNQLTRLDELQLLSGYTGLAGAPKAADWTDTTQSLDNRVKAYLDVNCAHCHSTTGQALQSGLLLGFAQTANTAVDSVKRGVCKKPLAYAGPGLPYKYDIVPGSPETSILLYRTSHIDTEAVMPVIGRAINHDEANVMLAAWIRAMMPAGCTP